MELKEAASCGAFHHRSRIHCGHTCCKELIWIRSIIEEIIRPLTEPTVLHCKNQSAIALTHDRVYHARSKHIDIQFHFIRETIMQNTIKLTYCPTNEMVADMLMKALNWPKLEFFSAQAGLSLHAHM
jgi:hypothetical protein